MHLTKVVIFRLNILLLIINFHGELKNEDLLPDWALFTKKLEPNWERERDISWHLLVEIEEKVFGGD